jgi:hypothetical protein
MPLKKATRASTLTRSVVNKLKRAYYDVNSSTAYSSASVLIQAFKNEINPEIIKHWLLMQENYALHHPRRLRFQKLKSFSFEPGFVHIDLSPNTRALALNNDKNFYLFVMADSFTRKIDAELIKNKKADSIIAALKKLMKRNTIKIIYSDMGTEFLNSKVENFLSSTKLSIFMHAIQVLRHFLQSGR